MGGCVAPSELLNHRFQRLPFDVLHDEEQAAVRVDPDIVNGDDARMVEAPDGLHLFHEASHRGGVVDCGGSSMTLNRVTELLPGAFPAQAAP